MPYPTDDLIAAVPQTNRYGLIPSVDPRDQTFMLADAVPEGIPVPEFKYWRTGAVLDQGQTPECVAFATEEKLLSSPIRQAGLDPQVIYDNAQAIDGIPMPHDGTTPRAAMAYLLASGYIESYRWGWNMSDVWPFLGLVGPVLLGCAWLWSMEKVDSRGFVRFDPSSGIAGGHCVLLYGYNARGDLYFQNSWGTGWGRNGKAKIKREHADLLFDTYYTEVVSGVEIKHL